MPLPTRAARAAFLGAVLGVAIALAATSPSALVLAGSLIWALSVALALTIPVGAKLRRERLEFAWWHTHGSEASGSAGAVVGSPFRVRCYIRNRGDRALHFGTAEVVTPDGVTRTDDTSLSLALAPRARTEFELTFVPAACGRVVLQGLSVTVPGPFGLFEAPLYFPNPLVVKVLPRASRRALAPHLTATGLPVERTGQTLLRRPGGSDRRGRVRNG